MRYLSVENEILKSASRIIFRFIHGFKVEFLDRQSDAVVIPLLGMIIELQEIHAGLRSCRSPPYHGDPHGGWSAAIMVAAASGIGGRAKKGRPHLMQGSPSELKYAGIHECRSLAPKQFDDILSVALTGPALARGTNPSGRPT